jgi:hypothetical protein
MVGFFFDNLCRNGRLCSHGVYCYDAAPDFEHVQKFGDGRDYLQMPLFQLIYLFTAIFSLPFPAKIGIIRCFFRTFIPVCAKTGAKNATFGRKIA